MSEDGDEALIAGSLSAIVTFLACWVVCAVNYGFWGFAFGWLPGLVLAAVVGFIMALFWRGILGCLGFLILLALLGAAWLFAKGG